MVWCFTCCYSVCRVFVNLFINALYNSQIAPAIYMYTRYRSCLLCICIYCLDRSCCINAFIQCFNRVSYIHAYIQCIDCACCIYAITPRVRLSVVDFVRVYFIQVRRMVMGVSLLSISFISSPQGTDNFIIRGWAIVFWCFFHK